LKNFVIIIMQLSRLISALEFLTDFLSILTMFKASNVMPKADIGDVIYDVPGQPTLSSVGVVPEVNNMLLLLATRNEELDRGLRDLRFLLGRAKPKAKMEMENIVKLLLPLHHEELMKSCVEDLVVHWQAAVVSSGHGIDN